MSLGVSNATYIEHNLPQFNAAMARYVDELHMCGPVVVKQQAGLLARSLINLTPPKSAPKTKERIRSSVGGKFAILRSENPREFVQDQAGRGDVSWYAFQPKGIFGVARDKDCRQMSDEELYQLNLVTKVNKQGRLVAGKRGKQTVYIWKRFLTNPGAVSRLVKRIQEHVGRLKAGWVVGWRAGGAPAGGMNAVPGWVLKHETGARGYVVDGLGIANAPEFTMANYAVGASEEKLGPIVSSAMRVRAKAMTADVLLYVKGVKKV